MKRRKLFIALPMALAVVIGSGALVWASVNETVARPCADIVDGEGKYTAPTRVKDALGNPTAITTPGNFEFTMNLAAASCLDVTYGLVLLAQDPYDPPATTGVPVVLSSTTVPGDATSSKVGFDVEINEDLAQSKLCAYLYTSGGTGGSSTGKTGAAFDGTAAAQMLDRAPDGPTASATDPDASSSYCFYVSGSGSGGRSYN